MVLVDESCGPMGFERVPITERCRMDDLTAGRGLEVTMREDARSRIPSSDSDVGQRVYLSRAGMAICLQDKAGKLLDGLDVHYSVTLGRNYGLAGYQRRGLLAVVMPLDCSPREVRA
jgi:hypothetical protein